VDDRRGGPNSVAFHKAIPKRELFPGGFSKGSGLHGFLVIAPTITRAPVTSPPRNSKLQMKLSSLYVFALAAILFHSVVLTCRASETQSLVVTITSDAVNNGDNQTSLREALAYAAQLGGTQTITFSNTTAGGATNFYDGTAHTIALLGGALIVSSDVKIAGPGAKVLTVDAQNAGAGSAFVVADPANVVFDALTVTGGTAIGFGGGIENESNGNLTVSNCTISNNSALNGGGIDHRTNGNLTITNSTISGNATSFYGGGIYIDSGGTVKLFNSTFSGNNAPNNGGAILHSGTGAVQISNCTISQNSSNSGGGIESDGGTVTVANSIISDNTGDDVVADCTSRGHNLLGSVFGTGFTNGKNGDQVGILDPKLGPLQDNGGPTKTMAPLFNSPAVDAGDNAQIPIDPSTNLPFTTDQRGLSFARITEIRPTPGPAVVDIGAFETRAEPATFAAGVAANGVSVDVTDAPLDLTSATIGATPNGTFFGMGVASNTFHTEWLSAGTYAITYYGPGDNSGNIQVGSFNINVTAADPYFRVIATAEKGGLQGSEVPGEPTVAIFSRFGLPSIDEGQIGALVNIDLVLPAIFLGTAGDGGIVARKGDAAPAAVGTVGKFSTFGQPVFGGGATAFTANLTGAPKTSATGLWSTLGGSLHLVAGSVTAPNTTGVPVNGLLFDKIQSYVLSADGQALTFVATLKGTGVKATNKTGIFQETAAGITLLFRTGDLCDLANSTFGTGPDLVKTLALFAPAKTIPGQRRSYAGGNRVVEAVATFTKGRQALLLYSVNGVASSTVAVQNTSLARLGLPSVNADGEFALRAGLHIGTAPGLLGAPVSARNDQSILTGKDQASLSIIAREGSPVSPAIADVFTAFEEPAHNDASATAFFARVKAPKLPASQTSVLIYNSFVPANHDFESVILARTGTPAAELTGGELWKNFTAMALPDSAYGPVFLARLSGPGVKAANGVGLWATDLDGNVRLVLRTGNHLSINGVDKTVSLINTLGAAKNSPGQGRYVDRNGSICTWLTFTDHSTALVLFGLPTAP